MPTKVLFDDVVSDEDLAQADRYWLLTMRTHDVAKPVGAFVNTTETPSDILAMGHMFGASMLNTVGLDRGRLVLDLFLTGAVNALMGHGPAGETF